MIIKRKYFSEDNKEDEKDKRAIKVGVSAGLGAGSSALLVNKLSKDNVLDKIAYNIEWKKGKPSKEDTIILEPCDEVLGRIADKIEWKKVNKQNKNTNILEHRGEKFQKIADQFGEGGKVRKFLKSKKGKTAIIGTTALGFGLAAHKSSKKKNKKEKED
jgi:hypothetical protein